MIFSGCTLIALVAVCLSRSHQENSAFGIVYGICLLACSLCSYLYTTRFSGLSNAFLRQLDHAAIFLLIAGTYTPFTIADPAGLFGIRLLYWVWSLALTGVTMRLIFRDGYDKLFVGLYVMLGWLFIAAIADASRSISTLSLVFLGLGALTYSIGAVIFARNKSRWADPIWHASVLIASVFHFVAIMIFVTQSTGA